jgi:AcrR family transcriptional regulator
MSMPEQSARKSGSGSTKAPVGRRRRYAPRLPPEQRREQLIDAALSVILAHGYEGVSVEAVARAAGVTRPVVYDHFTNLTELLQSLLGREERCSLEQLSRVVPEDAADHDPAEVLAGGVRRFLESVSERPKTWRLILFPPAGTPATVRDLAEQNRARILGRIERLVAGAVERAELPVDLDVELTARAVRDLAEEAGRMVLTDPERYTPERYELFVKSVLALLGFPRRDQVGA